VGTWQDLLNFLTSNVTACNMTPARYDLNENGLEEQKSLSCRKHAVGLRVRINDDVQTDWNMEYNVAVKSILDN
jgi:hypothetical protein